MDNHVKDYTLREEPAGPLIAQRAPFERLVGREIPEAVFQFWPWGRRIIVARATPDRRSKGGIYYPDQTIEPPTRGWVLSVGPDVGLYTADLGGCPFRREQLLGCEVLFGCYAGQPLHVGEAGETTFESMYTLMLDTDVWGHLRPTWNWAELLAG